MASSAFISPDSPAVPALVSMSVIRLCGSGVSPAANNLSLLCSQKNFGHREKSSAARPVVSAKDEPMTLDERKERDMKLTLMALGLAMAAGCAHGTAVRSAATELRGSTRVAESGRMLLAGPETVHASVDGPRPVSLFVVERVHGDDRDCSAVLHPQSV